MEDLCFMLDSMGLITGVDLEKLLLVREIAAQNLASNLMTGALARAGLPKHYKTAQERSTVSA
jgi:hydroxymethylglutaryl-CoA lyase